MEIEVLSRCVSWDGELTGSIAASPTDALALLGATLKLLADPTRLRIFDLLMQGVQCNCEIGDALGISPNLISHHLGALRRAGLVDVERDSNDARWLYYSVNRDALHDVRELLAAFLDADRIQERQPQCGPAAQR
jgi:ArsR family transcriptional regulator